MRRRIPLLFVALACASPAVAGACLDYEPKVVTLQGKLEIREYPGPPNYESTAKGDRAEWAAMLELASPVCANGVAGDPLQPAEQDIRQIHLVPMHEAIPASFDGKQVTVTGTLFHSFTAHHRSRLLLNVQSVK